MKIFFDGGCRPNPGAMEIAAVAQGRAYVRQDIGQGSSFDAEWLALIYAVEVAGLLGVKDVALLGDSATVVGQASGRVKCRGDAIAHHARFMASIPAGTSVRVRLIKRTQNLAGIALARLHDR
ncbi:reverse transcriptase-like protein [Sphingomonas sp. 28-62-11]|uniref:reverse transcriptase-like protein n=1 Tax=Sphingomonas sp. 28-62-11 TaxID=1970432 RepID=UPI0035A86422